MYSIIEVGGKQYTVKQGDQIAIDKVNKKENEKIEFNNIIMIKDNDKVEMGSPYLKNAKVEAKVLGDGRDKKVYTFKYRKRHTFKKLIGHKQPYTMVEIEKISYK